MTQQQVIVWLLVSLFFLYLVYTLHSASKGLDGVMDWAEAHRLVFMLYLGFMLFTFWFSNTDWPTEWVLTIIAGTVGLGFLKEFLNRKKNDG